jgi:hypothetical protein
VIDYITEYLSIVELCHSRFSLSRLCGCSFFSCLRSTLNIRSDSAGHVAEDSVRWSHRPKNLLNDSTDNGAQQSTNSIPASFIELRHDSQQVKLVCYWNPHSVPSAGATPNWAWFHAFLLAPSQLLALLYGELNHKQLTIFSLVQLNFPIGHEASLMPRVKEGS